MTIEELAASHAISFHDAELVGLRVDYASDQLVLTVNVDVADPNQSRGTPEFRRSRLSFAGCQPFRPR